MSAAVVLPSPFKNHDFKVVIGLVAVVVIAVVTGLAVVVVVVTGLVVVVVVVVIGFVVVLTVVIVIGLVVVVTGVSNNRSFQQCKVDIFIYSILMRIRIFIAIKSYTTTHTSI